MRGDQEFIERHGLTTVLRSALDATRDLFYVYDTDNNLVAWNERLEEVTGYDEAELLTMDPAEFVHPEDRAALAEYVDSAWEDGGRLEGRLLTADGSAIPYEFFGDPLCEDGDLVGRVGVGRRVTERWSYERRLGRRDDQLERVASLIRHDVRGPLSAAQGYLELYRETGDEEHFEGAMEAQKRVAEIVDGALDLMRPETSVEETEPVRLSEACLRSWNVGIAVTGDGTSDLELGDLPVVEADRALLCELLENLFRNAIQHSEGDVVIEVGPLESGGFYVADDGPGIPESEREAVFEWGYSDGDDGTGLGLALVREVAGAHGWQVDLVESERGGARFEIHV